MVTCVYYTYIAFHSNARFLPQEKNWEKKRICFGRKLRARFRTSSCLWVNSSWMWSWRLRVLEVREFWTCSCSLPLRNRDVSIFLNYFFDGFRCCFGSASLPTSSPRSEVLRCVPRRWRTVLLLGRCFPTSLQNQNKTLHQEDVELIRIFDTVKCRLISRLKLSPLVFYFFF